jgi:hypothetical protein
VIRSLQDELSNPSVAAFIDAADVTLNSNTHVMRFDLGTVPVDARAAIDELIRSDVFSEAVFAGDDGFWDYYRSLQVVDGVSHYSRRPGTLLVPNANVSVTKLTPYGLVDKLILMLASRRASPYSAQMPLRHAYTVVGYLLGALFEVSDPQRLRGCDQRGRLVSLLPVDATAVCVRPNFLNSTGYYVPTWTDETWDPVADGRLAYFDGGRGDACVAIFRGTRCTVILTNGSG